MLWVKQTLTGCYTSHSRDVPYQSLIKVWLREKLHDQ